MQDDITFLSQKLIQPDKTNYNKWRTLLEAPTKTRVQEKINHQYLRLLTLQLTCVAEKLINRLEDPFNQPPKDNQMQALTHQTFDRYRTLLLRIKLSSQQQLQGSQTFSQIVKHYDKQKEMTKLKQQKPQSQQAKITTKQVTKTKPSIPSGKESLQYKLSAENPEDLHRTSNQVKTRKIQSQQLQKQEEFEFDPSQCYTHDQFDPLSVGPLQQSVFNFSDLQDIPQFEEEVKQQNQFFQDTENYDVQIAENLQNMTPDQMEQSHVDEMEYTYFSATVKRLKLDG